MNATQELMSALIGRVTLFNSGVTPLVGGSASQTLSQAYTDFHQVLVIARGDGNTLTHHTTFDTATLSAARRYAVAVDGVNVNTGDVDVAIEWENSTSFKAHLFVGGGAASGNGSIERIIGLWPKDPQA